MTETAMEIARREADEAEADDAAGNGDATGASEPEPEPEPPPIDERDVRAMEKEESRHRAAVEKIMGDGFTGFEDCPLCTIFPAGFVPHFAQVPDELAAQLGSAVAAYFEGAELIEPPYPEARTMTRCPSCDGWGQVRSGARNALHRNEQCPDCTGNGYVPRAAETPPGYPQTAQPGQVLAPTQPPPMYVDVYGQPTPMGPDAFGQAWGHPNFGSPPQPAAAPQAVPA